MLASFKLFLARFGEKALFVDPFLAEREKERESASERKGRAAGVPSAAADEHKVRTSHARLAWHDTNRIGRRKRQSI